MFLFRWVWTGEIDFTSCLLFGLGQNYLFINNVFILPWELCKNCFLLFSELKKSRLNTKPGHVAWRKGHLCVCVVWSVSMSVCVCVCMCMHVYVCLPLRVIFL